MVALNMIVGLYGIALLFAGYAGICMMGIRRWERLKKMKLKDFSLVQRP